MWWVVLIVVTVAFFVWYLFFWNRRWHQAVTAVMKCIETGDLAGARTHLARTYDAVNKLQTDDARVLIVHLEEARLLSLSRDYSGSVSILRDVLESCDCRRTAYRNVYSRALLNLAEALSALGEDVEAGQLFLEALDFREHHFGPTSRDAALVLKAYAEFLADRGRFDEAEALVERGLEHINYLRQRRGGT